ncbi:hypothetical protein EB796_018283 [Bugula neritina]|uniref:Uncharacterized protein n=1 Tax=Bugula neritina TaxID=10212 RepID=A0A7J7JBP2_BUGNE|nr:hypothetical protein EB796_018283 [Bugula neritina]
MMLNRTGITQSNSHSATPPAPSIKMEPDAMLNHGAEAMLSSGAEAMLSSGAEAMEDDIDSPIAGDPMLSSSLAMPQAFNIEDALSPY